MSDTDAGGKQDAIEVTGSCRACGTMMGAVSEAAWDRMMARHVLNEHAEEAPEPVLEEARERLDGDSK